MFPILSDRAASAAGLLSGGEQQMLAFGRALMSQPTVMLLDEPSMGLAPAVVDSILAKVRQMADSGIGILMVEQNAEAGLDVADDVVAVARGEVVFTRAGRRGAEQRVGAAGLPGRGRARQRRVTAPAAAASARAGSAEDALVPGDRLLEELRELPLDVPLVGVDVLAHPGLGRHGVAGLERLRRSRSCALRMAWRRKPG